MEKRGKHIGKWQLAAWECFIHQLPYHTSDQVAPDLVTSLNRLFYWKQNTPTPNWSANCPRDCWQEWPFSWAVGQPACSECPRCQARGASEMTLPLWPLAQSTSLLTCLHILLPSLACHSPVSSSSPHTLLPSQQYPGRFYKSASVCLFRCPHHSQAFVETVSVLWLKLGCSLDNWKFITLSRLTTSF